MLGAAAGVGTAASLVAGAESAEAANNPVLLNQGNNASAETTISSSTNGITVFEGFVSSTADSGTGVLGNDESSNGGYGEKGFPTTATAYMGFPMGLLHVWALARAAVAGPTAGETVLPLTG